MYIKPYVKMQSDSQQASRGTMENPGKMKVISREEVDTIVNSSLKQKVSLNDVEIALEHQYDCTLSQDDRNYIGRKYTELLIEFWLDEASESVLINDPLKLMEELSSVNSLQDCFSIGLNLPYNTIMKELDISTNWIKTEEKKCILKFKSTLLAFMLLKTAYLVGEINFHKSLVKTMKSSKRLKELCNKELGVKAFLESDEDEATSFKAFLQTIINGCVFNDSEEEYNLKAASRAIIEQDKYFFVKDIKGSIKAYLSPVDLTKRFFDGRRLLEVKGEHIVISQVLQAIERTDEFFELEEIRFVNAGVVHIDENLNYNLWHGKNVVIFAESIVVSNDKKITWDVSGKDAENEHTKPAGTSSIGVGLDGAEGKPGESGGNILIICDEIQNGHNLMVVSNGGKGSNGQSGGNGCDGRNGDYMSETDFKKNFPPVSKLFDKSKQENLMKTKLSVMNDVDSAKFSVLGNLVSVSKEDLGNILDKCIKDSNDIYFEIKTKAGSQILFSFYYGGKFEFCESYLFHKGSDGEPGKEGGKGGVGGKGGFAGEVKIIVAENPECMSGVIEKCGNKGKNGESGESGIFGNPGISGRDCAYLDSTKPTKAIKILSKVQFPKYYITDPNDCQRLVVQYSSEMYQESVYCPHNGQYAGIVKVKKEAKQSFKMSSSHVKEILTESQYLKVLRKKTISPSSIMGQYDHQTSTIGYDKLSTIEKQIKQMHEEITNEEMLQHEQIAKEARITRNIEFSHDHYDQLGVSSTSTSGVEILNNIGSLLNDAQIPQTVSSTSSAVCDFNSVIKRNLDLQELRLLWNSDNIQAIYRSKEESIREEQILLNSKYQLVALYELEQTFHKLNHPLPSCSSFQPKVVGSVDKTLNLSRELINEVESYLCDDTKEKRSSIIRKLGESANDTQFCMAIFNLYLDDCEFDDCEKFLSDNLMQGYKKHYNWFKLKKAKRMYAKLVPLLNDIASNQELHSKFIKAITDQNIHLKIDVEHQIRGTPLLNSLYEKYIEEVNKAFVWKSVLLTPKGLIEKLENGFKYAINQKGPSSVFFREVVARLFKTNILLYSINEFNQMVLTYNHNPSADEVVHILLKDNQCFKLEVDDGMSKMVRAHEQKGEVCNKIQLYVDSIKGEEAFKEELDNFISNSPFSLAGYNGVVSKSTEIKIKISHMLIEDENIDYIVNSFDLDEDKQVIRSRLTLLKHDYVDYQNFLYYIALHLRTEGTQLSAKELCCIINFILKSVMDCSSKTNLTSWIIAAYHQKDWIVEFLLLKLDLYLKQRLDDEWKSIWRKHLCKTNRDISLLFFERLSDDHSLNSFEDVEEILLLISQTPCYDIGLSQLRLDEWKYYLRDVLWNNKVRSTGNWSEEELKSATFYLTTMENAVGKEFCCNFIETVKKNSNSISTEKEKRMVLNTMKHLMDNESLLNGIIIEHLSGTDVCQWEELVQIETFSSGEERTLDQLIELIQLSSNTSKYILDNIGEIKKSVQTTSSIFHFLKLKVKDLSKLKTWISNLMGIFKGNMIPLLDKAKSRDTKDTLNINDKLDLTFQEIKNHLKDPKSLPEFICDNLDEIFLATICLSIYIVESKKILRNPQLLAIVTFLKTSENVLGQVSTGEGKSFIITSVSIMKALSGSKVDIITSSHVLAERDVRTAKPLCQLFGIEVGHNCSENIENRKDIYSKCCVVYGELTYFQRDYLLDRVYNNNILGDRTYETILVDEVDSMLLDKGNNVLYLSHDIPGLDKLEPLFVYIWKCLNVPPSANTEEFFNVKQLKENILYQMYGLITKEDIQNHDLSQSENCVSETWKHLIKEEIIDSDGKILQDNLNDMVLRDLANKCPLGGHIEYLLKKVLNRAKQFEIPNYLERFVEDHLDQWIDSASSAISLQNNIDYVVDVDRSDDSADRTPNIIILDRDTGTDMTNSQWDQGLHQFLQLKHGCRLSHLTFKAVFISNVSYLKLYESLLGLTGTLGSRSDRDLLKEVYKVEFVTIPTTKAKCFREELPILCNSLDDWLTNIFETVYKITETRSALIICNSLNDVFTLQKYFEEIAVKSKLSPRQVHTYTRDYEEFSIAESLDIGEIIISTNLAGRGTDIKLSDKLVNNGGLHVCLSFLPSNRRIEEQAFGRSARNGQPGSGQLIFKEYGQNNVSKIIDLKKKRDVNEIFRVSDVKRYYETKVKREEELFHKFLEKYNSLRDSSHSSEIKSILLMSCLDQWAFWLEKNASNTIPFSFDKLIESISKLLVTDLAVWTRQIQDPFQLTKLGLLYLKQGKDNVDKALQIFDFVIKTEPVFSEAAYYYKACARTSKSDIDKGSSELETVVNELRIVEKKLKGRIESSCLSGYFVDYLKNFNCRNILQVDSFKQQQQIVSSTHEVFLNSIWNIIGCRVTPEEFMGFIFIGKSEIDNEIVNSKIFNDLIDKGLIKQRIKPNVTERDLCFTSDYGISPGSIKNLLDANFGNGGSIQKSLKENVVLPSRELFWKELVSIGILEKEEKLIFVNNEKLSKIDPSLPDQIKELTISIKSPMMNRVSLYLPEELGQMKEHFNQSHSLFVENVLIEKLGETKFKFLEKENAIVHNKLARFKNVPMEHVELTQFDSISLDDFLKVGISKTTSLCIIDNLIQEKIIGVKNTRDPTRYELLIDNEEIDKIELKTHKAYSSDVQSLISNCFAFRLAIQKLQHVLPLCEGDYSNLCLPLRINIYKSFWFEFQEKGIIEWTLSREEISSGKLKGLYAMPLNRERYLNMFSEMYGNEKSKQIVDDLISKEWLVKLLPKTTNEAKRHLSNLVFSSGSPNYYINYKCDPKSRKIELRKKPLSIGLQRDKETIELILLCQIYISQNLKAIESSLKWFTGGIHEMGTPFLSLTPLEPVLTERRIPTSEISTFTLNGFDQVISLEEKKYTKRMKINTVCVTVLGLTEIAVGVTLQFWFIGNPLGIYFISQGIDDLVFVTGCALSGYFTWKSFLCNKALSLVTTSIACFRAFKSVYASKTTGLSLETLKERCLRTINKVFQSEVSQQLTKTQIISQVSKRLVAHTAEGIASGFTFHMVDCAKQQLSENLGESLMSLIDGDIEHTITNHSVFVKIESMYLELGHNKAKCIVEKSLSKVTNSFQNIIEHSFNSINLQFIKTLIARTISKDLNKLDLTEAVEILKAFGNIFTVLKAGWSHFQQITKLVSEILNDIEQDLQSEYNKFNKLVGTEIKKDNTFDEFKSQVLIKMQSGIKEVFIEHVNSKVLEPVLQFAGTYIEKFSLQMVSRARTSFLNNDEILILSNNKKQNFQKSRKGKSKVNRPDFFSTEFDEITCQMVKTRKNKEVLRYMVSENASMDIYCLEFCCKVIPFILEQEGVNVPNLKLEVDMNDTKYFFSFGNVKADTRTLKITPNADVMSNVRNNKILVTDFFNFLCTSFQEHYPEFKGLTVTLLQEMIIKWFDNFCDSQPSNSSTEDEIESMKPDCIWKNPVLGVSRINTECENKTPYQHSHYKGGWTFSPLLDVDLRERDKLTNLSNVHNHVNKGFETALGKVNAHIHSIQRCLRSFNLVLDDFDATKHQLIPPSPDMSELFHCYTVQYELVVPVMLKEIDRLEDFKVVLRLENKKPKNMPQLRSPLGPHIIYEVNPAKAKFLSKGVKGHILLNIDCIDTSYSLKDCHTAGELIVPHVSPKQETQDENVNSGVEDPTSSCTGNAVPSELQERAGMCDRRQTRTLKECDIIIIGDSLFKYINEYVKLPKCDFGVFPRRKVEHFKGEIMSFLMSYQGVKCVVLFWGGDIIKTNVPVEIVVSCIFDTVKMMQENITNVNVIICTLSSVKSPAKTEFLDWKIHNANQTLKEFCSRNRLLLVDTNSFICPKDLCRDGIYFNRNGYYKLGKHLSEICRQFVN